MHGTLSLQAMDGGRVAATFTVTFNPGAEPRTFFTGELEDEVDPNPAARGPPPVRCWGGRR